MSATENLALTLYAPSEYSTTLGRDFLNVLMGTNGDSNMQKIDEAVAALQSGKADLIDGVIPNSQLPPDLGKVFLVTCSISVIGNGTLGGVADHTPAEIMAAVNAGQIPVAQATYGDFDIYLYHVGSSESSGQATFLGAFNTTIVALAIDGSKSVNAVVLPSIRLATDLTPSIAGDGNVGSSQQAARADHVHPKEVSDEDRTTWNDKAAGTHASQHGIAGSDPITPDDIGALASSARGAADGVASLGADGKVPASQLPEISSVKTYTATIGTNWTEDSATGVKTQRVTISGIQASHTAKIDHAYTGSGTSADYASFVEAENQFLTYITNGFAETYNGGVKFTIFGGTNTVAIPIVVEVA